MNVLTITLEKRMQCSLISLMQGGWSMGALVGGGFSSALLHAEGTVQRDFPLAALVMVGGAVYCLPRLLGEVSTSEGNRRFRLPNAPIFGLAVIAFGGLFSEAAVSDWSAVFLRLVLGLPFSAAALGFSIYATAMAAARLLGHWILQMVTPATVLRGSGFFLIAGFLLILRGGTAYIAYLGLVLAGIGLANIMPILMAAAGRDGRMGARPAISAVSILGSLGSLVSPPLIGWLSLRMGLGHALDLVIVAGIVISLSPVLRVRRISD